MSLSHIMQQQIKYHILLLSTWGHHDTDECWLGPSTCIDQEVNTLRMTFDSGMGPAGWRDLLPTFYEDNAGSGLPRWPLRRIKPVSQRTVSLLCCLALLYLPPPPSDPPPHDLSSHELTSGSSFRESRAKSVPQGCSE